MMDLSPGAMLDRAAANSFSAYLSRVHKSDQGHPLTLASIHVAQLVHLDYCWTNGLDCLILAPMGHGKTQIFAVALPAFLIGNDPGIRIKLVSVVDDVASARVAAVREYIERDEDYHRVFPSVSPKREESWSRSKLTVHRDVMHTDPTLEAKGILGAGVGGRCDVLLIDDPVDQRSAASAAKRLAAREAYTQTWRTRMEATARMACIATVYHDSDVIQQIRRQPETCTLVLRIATDYQTIQFEVEQALVNVHGTTTHPLLALAA